VQVKNKRERSMLVRPPDVEQTSWLGSRDPVASGVKCRPHSGKNSKMKSWTVFWLSLKTKVEPGLRGSRVWQRLHRVRGVSSGSLENHLVPLLIHIAKTEDPRAASSRSDRCATTPSGAFEAEDTRRDRKACVEAKQVGHPFDGAMMKIPKFPSEVCIYFYVLGVVLSFGGLHIT
jgi:hypothetical protein